MSKQNIAILPGDGIGPEVITEARRVLEWFVARRKLDVRLDAHPYGAGAFRKHGLVLPGATEVAIRAAHAILLGAVGGMDADAIPRAARGIASSPVPPTAPSRTASAVRIAASVASGRKRPCAR